ncbi:MAG: NUDIX hydrolase [Chloroflexi bacterium]|nr:MAG: NUDIX hydrolase [Chloroflexota bacterium]
MTRTQPSLRFCASCGGRLSRRRVAGRSRSVCRSCGQIAYENAKPCAGALVVRDGKVLLVKRGVTPYRGWWDIPGGYLEADEHPEAGARRELREETGLRVRLRGLLGVYVDRQIRPHSLNFYYLAEVSGGRERASDDAVELGWFGPGELPARIAYPGHAKAVLADWRRRV